ncbi:tetratricopeptide repeat protein [Desulfosudis oleivorans]|uniref:tetratricopeptide repeat protein n=1 Tax=Desulfosudis oleivorans TaxID=181663 RepID=UPI0002D3F2FA|nr:tetratricopeptide repeat protein [Desulfosudis oleivorans]
MIPAVAGEGPLTISADQQIGLGDHFFKSGEYDRAVTAYETFLYFFPDHEQTEYSRLQIARAFLKTGKTEAALERFEKIYSEGSGTQFQVEAGFMAARCYTALGMKDRALSMLSLVGETTEDPAVRERIFYETGWTWLEAFPVLTETEIAAAAANFEQIPVTAGKRLHVQAVLDALEQARHDDDGLLASMKSPGLAGTLAVMPGAGYLYCGRYHDALISFLFNGAMMLAAWEAFDEGHEALGAVLSVVELGFYGGSIYGSMSAVHKHNHRRTSIFMEGLRSISAGFVPAGEGVEVRVSFQQPF